MLSITDKKFALSVALSYIGFLSAFEKEKLENKLISDNLDTPDKVELISIEYISQAVLRMPGKVIWPIEKLALKTFRAMKIMERNGIGLIRFDDKEYPPLLQEIHGKPYALYFRGNCECLRNEACAIVGTRKATGDGRRQAFNLAKALAEKRLPPR